MPSDRSHQLGPYELDLLRAEEQFASGRSHLTEQDMRLIRTRGGTVAISISRNRDPQDVNSKSNAGDMLATWREEYGQLEERHKDLERDYWQLQGQYSELQNQHRQILRLLSPQRS